MFLTEKICALEKLHSGMSYSAGVLAVSSMLMNQFLLNQVSLNRTTHNTKLGIDQLMKMLCPEAGRTLTLYFP